jgi:hypothetical protein
MQMLIQGSILNVLIDKKQMLVSAVSNQLNQIGVMNMGQNLKLCQECLGCLESHLLDGQLLQSQDKKRI